MILAVVSAQRSDGGTCGGDVGREMWGQEARIPSPPQRRWHLGEAERCENVGVAGQDVGIT